MPSKLIPREPVQPFEEAVAPPEPLTHCVSWSVGRRDLLSANQAVHFRDKAARAKRLRAMAGQLTAPIAFSKFRLMIEVYPPTRRRLDPHNLGPTVKHLIDGMTDAGWWEDDDHEHLTEVAFRYGGLSGVKDVFVFRFTMTEDT